MGEIRIVSPGRTRGYPYPVCKKRQSYRAQWKEIRRRGRQKKRWDDNTKEWTGFDFVSSIRAPDNRTRWEKIAARV